MAPKNPWKKGNSKNYQSVSGPSKHYQNAPGPSCSSSDTLWRENGEDFPALGATSHTSTSSNIWEERKAKQEEVKALEPQNEYDEEAMLQQALAMSMLEASKEEERRKELEEEYRKQMEALQNAPELLEEINATDEFVVDEHLELESLHHDNFYNKEKYEVEKLMKDSSSDYRHREPISSYKGAKPKINSAIDRFGGWGLKDTKTDKTETLSNFVEEVVYRKSSNSEGQQNVKYGSQNESENQVKSKKKSVPEEGIWSDSQDVKVNQGSNDKEILYDGRGTFIDTENGDWNYSDNLKENSKPPNISPNEVLDTWLGSDDVDDWGKNTVVHDKPKSDTAINNNLSCISVSDKPEFREMEDNKSSFVNSYTSTFCDNNTIRNDSNQSIGFSDSGKKLPLDQTDHTERNVHSPTKSSSQKFEVHEQNDFSLFRQPRFPCVINEMWSENNAGNASALVNKSKLYNETHTVNYTSDLENSAFSSENTSNDFDLPPILPPKPSSVVPSEVADVGCREMPPVLPPKPNSEAPAEVADFGCKEIPPILPPYSAPEISGPHPPTIANPLLNPAPEISLPQSPIINNPLLNPLLPGLNPMAGYCVDPLLMRQMLVLHNPFLASQIFAMEQYYRSIGMPIDMFSATNPIPQIPMPGLMNFPLAPNMFTDSLNLNLLPNGLLQAPTQLNPNPDMSDSEGNANIPEPKPIPEPSQTSQFDSMATLSNSSSLFEKDSDSSWHNSFLLNDSESVIPPPNPPSDVPHLNNTTELPKSSQNFDFANNVNSSSQVPNLNSWSLSQKKVTLEGNDQSFSTVTANKPKNEATGWGDPDDDSFDIHRSKASAWGSSWDDESVPTKPLRNLSLYEENKISDLRQPSKQPRMNPHRKNYR